MSKLYIMSSQAADCVSEEVSFGDDELKLAKPLRVSCWLNGAACSLKLNDHQGAITLCSKVICGRKTKKEKKNNDTRVKF